jgi:hypothetical protein
MVAWAPAAHCGRRPLSAVNVSERDTTRARVTPQAGQGRWALASRISDTELFISGVTAGRAGAASVRAMSSKARVPSTSAIHAPMSGREPHRTPQGPHGRLSAGWVAERTEQEHHEQLADRPEQIGDAAEGFPVKYGQTSQLQQAAGCRIGSDVVAIAGMVAGSGSW